MTDDQIKAKEAELSTALKSALDMKGTIDALGGSTGVADLKEQANRAVTEVAALTDEIKAARVAIDARQDEFEAEAMKRLRSGLAGTGVSTFEEGFTKAGIASDSRDTVEVKVNARAFLKDITNVTGAGLLQENYIPGIVAPGQRLLTIADLVAPGRTSGASISYPREISVTDNSAVQITEGALKGKSDFTFDEVTSNVATIAHFVKMSRQIMDDVPALASYIEERMRFFLSVRLEQQMLNGTVTAGQLQGIKPLATAYDATLDTILLQNVANQQILDVIGIAAYQVSLSEFMADGVTINPREGWRMRLLKDGQLGYLFASPTDGSPNLRPWGITAVETRAEAVDAFTMGAWKLGAQLFIREDITARLSTENEDDFVKNLVTLLVEMRAAQAVYRPAAFVKGTFTAALAV